MKLSNNYDFMYYCISMCEISFISLPNGFKEDKAIFICYAYNIFFHVC